jgi:hypothetical protein
MIKRSAAIYLTGFGTGTLVCLVVFLVYPSLYHWFLELLRKKVEAQSNIIEDPALMIGSNNLFASIMLAYGGYMTARIFLWLDTDDTSGFLSYLKHIDGAVRDIRKEHLKYYLALFAIPVSILFLNGFVLGAFFVLYTGDLMAYFENLLPHGYFEIPALILAGSIGLDIAHVGRVALPAFDGFEEAISSQASGEIKRFAVVVVLILIGANIEAGFFLAG